MQEISGNKRINTLKDFIKVSSILKQAFVLFSFLAFASLSAYAQNNPIDVLTQKARDHYSDISFWSSKEKADKAVDTVVNFITQKEGMKTDWNAYLKVVITDQNRKINSKGEKWDNTYTHAMTQIDRKLGLIAEYMKKECDKESCCSSWTYTGNPWEFDHWQCTQK